MIYFIFTAVIISSITFVAPSAVAYHDTLRSGGSISPILPIVVVVVVGMVGLGIWDRKMLKTKSKRKHRLRRKQR